MTNLRFLAIIFFFICISPSRIISQTELTNQKLYDTIPFIPELYQKKIAEFVLDPVIKGQIIFLGNSLTEGGKWDSLLNDSTVLNRGISGDITYGILGRINEIIERKPAKLFIMIGTNDIGKDIPVAVIIDNYRKIIEKVQKASPQTDIYIQSLLPVNPDHYGFLQHFDKEEKIIQVNKKLPELAEKYKCIFINLFPLFADKNLRLIDEYTYDGLHLNNVGYQIWVSYLRDLGAIE